MYRPDPSEYLRMTVGARGVERLCMFEIHRGDTRQTAMRGISVLWLLALAPLATAQPAGSRQVRDIERQRRFDELQQLQIDSRLRANEDIPANQRAMIDYGGYLTLQYFSIDDRNGDNHGLRQPELALYGRINLDAANEVFARVRGGYQDFNPGDKFTPRNDHWIDFDLERGYYRFDLAKYQGAYKGKTLPYNMTFQVGRDLVYWANGLTLGQVIDGGILDLSWRNLTLDLIAGVTPVRTVDFDVSRPNFDRSTRRGFYGGMLTWNPDTPDLGKHHPFIYALAQQDYNTYNFLVQGNLRTRFDYNSYYVGIGSTGSIGDHLLYGLEVAYEGGNTLSNSFSLSGLSIVPVKQSRNGIAAAAGDLRLDYLVNDKRNTRFSFEAVAASGDVNRGNSSTTFDGSKPRTRDKSFNGFGLINSGLAFAPEVSNLGFFRLGASTFPLPQTNPFRRMQVGVDYFLYEKLDRRGGFGERTNNRHYLGLEPDA